MAVIVAVYVVRPPLETPAVIVPELGEKLSQCGSGDADQEGAVALEVVSVRVSVWFTGAPPAGPLKFNCAGAAVKVLTGATAAGFTVSVTGREIALAAGEETFTVPM